jgi:hypothetical protein
MRRPLAAVPLAVLAALVPTSAASAAPATFRGTTSQDTPLTLTVAGTRVTYRFTFVAECDGEELRLPIRGTTRLTAKRDFLGEGRVEGADGEATFQINGNAARPTTTIRTGTIELTSGGCDRIQATWRARKDAAKP